jgi:hypothetical protein
MMNRSILTEVAEENGPSFPQLNFYEMYLNQNIMIEGVNNQGGKTSH